ncbi:MAG: undecaprenyldiphospho-muramoylpentapeptide beta-N-acetylglucosaminyltransferase [Pusillimonas sp.]|mgnify:CR=1 FL=1|nr:undecaprenyldiphospho-muramoylpentapeptide beta-N-acetylglucosaminyltransferase [Pusillimonas sp.]
MSTKTLLIMAGGTGGHIMPGLAVAEEMQSRGWHVVWLGHPEKMEGKLVAEQGIAMEPLRFSGLRGKGFGALLALPFRLVRACIEARTAMRKTRPDVVLGMGGYVAFPGGLMARLVGIPLLVHEQNAIAGTANRWLARMARKVMVGFPGALPGALMVGNPVRSNVICKQPAKQRYGQRQGPLRLLVLGGSLGARPLNLVLPAALALMPTQLRPQVTHQTGAAHLDSVKRTYEESGVDANCVAFINDMGAALAESDLVICRAGAMTVAEVAAAGVAALFVPLPHAIDDHQTANARYLSDCHGGWLQPQSAFTTEWLSAWLSEQTRSDLAKVAGHAHEHACLNASQLIADACESAVRRPA